MVSTETPICDFGWPAPDFALPATDERVLTLADVRGERGLLVFFICNHCPYVQAIRDRLVRDVAELQTLGIGACAIMSNDPTDYPEDSFANMKRIAEQYHFSFPYLYDETQLVARRYGAVCTPDFFGFNADLKLQYRGRLDASRKEPAVAATRDLFLAMKQVALTGHGPTDQVPSVGCSIKWKEGVGA
ncbi:MAG TPA: thioredoxin family protein [Acidiferrobacter sp.]|nr:thioredoxin family protein [Acidiferrobacter sp.]